MKTFGHTPEKALVTGGGGFLGAAIVRALVARGDHVRSFSRRSHCGLAGVGVEQVQGDIADAGALIRACSGMDVVYHTAAKPPPWGSFRDYYRTNLTGTANVIHACHANGIARLIHTSTPSVIFNGRDLEGVDESAPYPSSYHAFYPQTKAWAEQAVVAAGAGALRTIILRPHEIWGPEDPHFAPRLIARSRRLRRIGDGRNLVDTTYIENAAEAHLLAADRLRDNPALSGRVYFISQGEPVPAWDMIDAILEAAGLEPVRGRISYRLAWTLGLIYEKIYGWLSLPGEPPMTRFVADALSRAHWFDIGAARRDLGYEPKVSTTEGLKRLTAWFSSRSLRKDMEEHETDRHRPHGTLG